MTDPEASYTTTELIKAAQMAEAGRIDGQLEVLRERLRGIDRANELLDENMNRVPTEVQQEVGRLQELMNEKFISLTSLMDEKFSSVDTQFKERDTRQEREARDNKIAVDAAFAANKVAVDAAFAAQKEAAANENKANQKAIDRSETATSETIRSNQAATTESINKLSELRQAGSDAVLQQLSDMKERVGRMENAITGIAALKQGGGDAVKGMYALVGLVIAVITVFIALAANGVFKR